LGQGRGRVTEVPYQDRESFFGGVSCPDGGGTKESNELIKGKTVPCYKIHVRDERERERAKRDKG